MDKCPKIAQRLYDGQAEIVSRMEELEGGAFSRSGWEREGVGDGRTCFLEDGEVFERAAVNVSLVRGAEAPEAVTVGHDRADRAGKPFRATGISMIVHPRNPYAASFHANFRYFEVGDDEWWFGGGMDLTPMYPREEDCRHFHRTLKEWCDRHREAPYERWKTACDDYFHLRHRQEMRGVGGVFFDSLTAPDADPDRLLPLIEDGVATIVPAYLPLVERRHGTPYGAQQRRWQLLRRGRYVEFNLIYDRGTLFGLQTGVNIDSVLMSMPPLTGWSLLGRPEEGSEEAAVASFLQPRDWARA